MVRKVEELAETGFIKITMSSESMLPYYMARSSSTVGMFDTSMGAFNNHCTREFNIFTNIMMFENKFNQIKRDVINVCIHVLMATMGTKSYHVHP